MTTSISLSRQLAQHLQGIRFKDLPDAVVVHSKILVLDLFGVVLGAEGSTEANIMRDSFAQNKLSSDTGALLWGTSSFASFPDAALYNGTLAHILELDDFGGADHSGAVIIPALVSACKQTKVTGKQFIEALVIGYEASKRTLEAAGAYRGHNNAGGWHSTGTCGAVGAACAVAHVLGLSLDQWVSAMGFSLTMSGGTWAFQQDGAMSKRLHSGWAAHLGLYAALLARSGLTGPEFAYEAEWGGFLNTYAKDTKDPEKLLEGFGEHFRILDSGIKLYPCCRDNHSSIDVMLVIHERIGGDVEKLESVRIESIPEILQMLDTRYPKTILDAQLSLPHCAAVALLRGRVELEDFTLSAVNDAEIEHVKNKIELIENKDLPFNSEPLVTVTFKDGSSASYAATFGKGAPENPASLAEVHAKFKMLSKNKISASTQAQLLEATEKLEFCDDMSSFEGYLRIA